MKVKKTIKDVAREANVSIATVSRVINGKDKVKQETRLKILDAIEKMNFKPDYSARSMKQKKTKMIGFILPELASYWSELAEVIQNELWDKGYALLLASHNREKDKIISVLELFEERNVDGIIVGPLTHGMDEKVNEKLSTFYENGISMVGLQSQNLSDIISVDVDHLGGAINAVEYLISRGHNSIAYIGTDRASKQRELGYKNCLMTNNIPINEDIIYSTRNDANFMEIGYKAVLELLKGNPTFTAIFCANDLIAYGALNGIREKKLLVPNDISVVGFDDISTSSIISPSLTTIKQPIHEMGKTAVNILIEQMESSESIAPRKIILPTQLIKRDT
ncbi:LacI family DNA-binding transcriptional regulator [Gracilibacillus lacisalsi]|uniref:LacI family DNA-binding transcriptional regulator n=1 Tax=Gracilibacillus lacisalsi TaxID=393087 RepID=UPI000368CA2E|nr:LacI family DNA-binding transcriptional regulator [Gracilibacillus lacisalsi]